MSVSSKTTVGAIVAERLGRARLFDRLGVDYCCHGQISLEEACRKRGLDVEKVLAEITLSDALPFGDGQDGAECTRMTASELVDHVITRHHDYLREELPRLSGMIDRVVAAHHANHPELAELRKTFAGLRTEMDSHTMKEEQVLFPLIKQLEQAQALFPMHCGTVQNPIRVMMHEHDAAGEALARMKTLTGGYQPPADGCPTFQALYVGLAALEADLHRHIHKENNILFPKAEALEAALSTAAV